MNGKIAADCETAASGGGLICAIGHVVEAGQMN
jgi:hypothetical protein